MIEPNENETTLGQKPDGGSGGSKARSETAYPYFGLSKGIEIVRAVRRAGGSEASNADVMRELNVTKVAERIWSYGIPAAIQFGLIERIGRGAEGRIKLTELANRIVLPANPEEERIAKMVAIKNPELYSVLLVRYAGHPVPTKDGLKNVLYRDYRILESMAPVAADAFLDSLKAAELISPNNDILAIDGAAPLINEQKAPKDADHRPQEESRASTQTIEVPKDFIVYKCKIGKGKIIEIPLPPDFTTTEAEKLHAFLLTQVDDDEEFGK